MRSGFFLGLCAALFLATPALAAESPTGLTAAGLGLDGLTDPAPVSEATPAFEQRVQPARPLADLVGAYAGSDTADAESECLARAVYWESRGEPLSGQLAVAEVVINRARSGRFAPTLCGVVRQPYQFSFVRRGAIPQPPSGSRDWHIAVAIARIATERLADGGAPSALFFHARRISPGWRLTRVATVGNHVFYR
ncbi:MAG TPA: cell wall hydrolase [Allosphingosinicella sp.]|jgi:spore germination cell wall hydrolase CwlJ-like protein|nr:cell wall hydrolase [Allosphingosinicella sp.]